MARGNWATLVVVVAKNFAEWRGLMGGKKVAPHSESLSVMTANRFVRLVFETAVDRVFSEGGEGDCSSCFRSVCSPSLLDDSELMIRRRFWEPAGIASSARRLAPPLLMLATVSDASAKSIFSAPPAASDSFKNSILERRPAFDRVAGMRQYCSCYTTKGLKLIFFSFWGENMAKGLERTCSLAGGANPIWAINFKKVWSSMDAFAVSVSGTRGTASSLLPSSSSRSSRVSVRHSANQTNPSLRPA